MEQAATADIPADTKGKKKKKKTWRNIALGVLAFISLIVWYGFQPLTGPVEIGICRTFIELQLRYPHTMRLARTDQYQDIFRLYYTYTGPFGEHRSSLAECRSTIDPATGQPAMTSIKIDRVELEEEKLRRFNQTIPFILQNNPSLVIPPPYTGDLNDLRR